MTFTNHQNLPGPLFRAVCNDDYEKGDADYTVTDLIAPPRIVALKRKHEKEMTEDAADRIWSLMGQLGHLVLERAATREIVEHRFYMLSRGIKVGGRLDLWDRAILLDYKFTSVYAVRDGLKPEWEQQCNLNALLCAENGFEVRGAQIACILRDWSVGEARRDHQYPEHQVKMLDVPLWPRDEQLRFLEGRVDLHQTSRENPRLCTPQERWQRPEKWAVMKKGRTRAVKLHDSEDAVVTHLATLGPGHYPEHRPAVETRCLDYCAVRQFCDFGKGLE